MDIKRIYKFIICFFISIYCRAQLDGNSLFTLPAASETQILSITDANTGALAYANDTQTVYVYDGSNWVRMEAETSDVYLGVFTITGTGDIPITGIPFSPSSASFVAHANVESPNINADNGVGNNSSTIANSFGTSNGFSRNDSGSIIHQSIYVGGSGNSINDISRFASNAHCIGIRYSNQNGDNLGTTTARVTSFTADGFIVNTDNFADGLIVLYKAYR
jgi:hypothetical protein